MVSGLVSERVCCSENRFQTFGAMETIEVTLEGLMKICGSGERAENREAPEALQ